MPIYEYLGIYMKIQLFKELSKLDNHICSSLRDLNCLLIPYRCKDKSDGITTQIMVRKIITLF